MVLSKYLGCLIRNNGGISFIHELWVLIVCVNNIYMDMSVRVLGWVALVLKKIFKMLTLSSIRISIFFSKILIKYGHLEKVAEHDGILFLPQSIFLF